MAVAKPLDIDVTRLLSLPIEPGPYDPGPYDPGLMQVAEHAIAAERSRVAREQIAKENELKLREAQTRFMRDPSGTSFIELHDRWEQVRPNERRPLFDFIVSVLRPGGLPRDGPFVWTSPEPDFEVPSPDWLKDD